MLATSQPLPGAASTPMGERVLARGGVCPYSFRLARDRSDVQAVQALRFAVFNLELNQGLENSFVTLRDADSFDEVCDHLLVEEIGTGDAVGTYRLQTGRSAATRLGYYSEQEFDFGPFEFARNELVELGRACVHRQHRNLAVLRLLWKGIAAYARERGCRHLIGCSSLSTLDSETGARAYSDLMRTHLAAPAWITRPLPACACPLDRLAPVPVKIPRLLGAYLSLGARICGSPAIDRAFKTTDFLTLLDLASLPSRVVDQYLT
ncbi:MAG: GNAT family N-acyltransferase [Verrucomicrobiota bacterium]